MDDQNERSTIVQPGQIVFLGHQGENLARRVIFDLSRLREQYPEGRFALAAQRKGDALPYPAARTSLDGDALTWTLTAADTGKSGYGSCELRCYDGEILAKSEVWQTFTLPALGGTGEAPSPAEDFIAALQRIADKVQVAQAHAPTISANDSWLLWDTEAQRYVDSGMPSRGAPGIQGVPGEVGAVGATGPQGPSGNDGATFLPSVSASGVLSWTNDGGKQNPASVDIVSAVIHALPLYDGGVD